MFGSWLYFDTPSGTRATLASCRVLVEHAGEGVLEDRSVVHPRAHHDLTVHGDPVVEQLAQPPQAHRTTPVAQHPSPHLGVGGVDAHVQRRQPLGDDPFEVEFGEPGEGGEVPVEERQPVVVVLQVEAGAQVRRQLVDEAELAVVVTGPHSIEHRARDLGPERHAGPLVDLDGEIEPAAMHVELEFGVVDQHPPLDHVPGYLAVDRSHLVAGPETRGIGRGPLSDGDDDGERHEGQG